MHRLLAGMRLLALHLPGPRLTRAGYLFTTHEPTSMSTLSSVGAIDRSIAQDTEPPQGASTDGWMDHYCEASELGLRRLCLCHVETSHLEALEVAKRCVTVTRV